MMEKLINSYVNKLTKQDILLFADKNNITLTNEEVDIILEIDTILTKEDLLKIKDLNCDCCYVLHSLHMPHSNTDFTFIFFSSFGTHLLSNIGSG